MPKGKGMAPLFLAFLLFHVEHFNVFNNREVMRLSLGAALADELVSDLLPVAVTTASFLAFVLLYRWNRFYVREKRGLAISCCLIAMVPVLWAVRDVVDGDSSAMLGCLAMGLFAFGHLCFLPAVIKRLAAIGPAKTVFLYGMVLACGTLLRAALERLPGEALIAFIVLTPFAMFACFRWIEGHGELRVDLDVEARALIPRTLLATLLAVGLLAGLAAGMAGMTAREKSVFVLLAKGYTSKLIAEKLNISPGTAKTHIKHIYSKLGLHSQQELIAVVEQNERQSQG